MKKLFNKREDIKSSLLTLLVNLIHLFVIIYLYEQFKKLYEKITDPSLMIRKVNLSACNLKPKEKSNVYEQVSLFENNESIKKEAKEDEQIKLAMLKIKHKYGKNAILKGMNLQERATTRERNRQIGGHHE